MNEHYLELRDLSISLAGRTLINVDTVVRGGEVLTVMGPSGSGKSTLLAAIAGFLPADFTMQGEVWLDGKRIDPVPAEQRGVGLLFQDPLLFPHMSVAGNLRFAMPAAEQDKTERLKAQLDEMNLGGFSDRDPATLSGGQKARVALLRLLLSQPRAVLLDEPFAKLDTHLRNDIRRQVFARLSQAALPCLLVTHDAEDAAAAGGPVIELAI